jgi:hypothetical protein
MRDVLAGRGVLHNELFAPSCHFLKALPGYVFASARIEEPPIGVPFDNCLLGRWRSGWWGRRHSMTSSARATKFTGTSIPSALAVLKFKTNSNVVDRTTGKSAGRSPAPLCLPQTRRFYVAN